MPSRSSLKRRVQPVCRSTDPCLTFGLCAVRQGVAPLYAFPFKFQLMNRPGSITFFLSWGSHRTKQHLLNQIRIHPVQQMLLWVVPALYTCSPHCYLLATRLPKVRHHRYTCDATCLFFTSHLSAAYVAASPLPSPPLPSHIFTHVLLVDPQPSSLLYLNGEMLLCRAEPAGLLSPAWSVEGTSETSLSFGLVFLLRVTSAALLFAMCSCYSGGLRWCSSCNSRPSWKPKRTPKRSCRYVLYSRCVVRREGLTRCLLRREM